MCVTNIDVGKTVSANQVPCQKHTPVNASGKLTDAGFCGEDAGKV